jgi:hypothetical protein
MNIAKELLLCYTKCEIDTNICMIITKDLLLYCTEH